MRSALSAFIVSLALSVVVFAGVSAAAAISVDKTSGSVNDTFVFTGAGFTPGTQFVGKYVPPSGKEYPMPDVIQADANGAFTVNFVPASTPAGDSGVNGTWMVSFCMGPEQPCWSIPIDVQGGVIY
jgi:hypothetical protein